MIFTFFFGVYKRFCILDKFLEHNKRIFHGMKSLGPTIFINIGENASSAPSPKWYTLGGGGGRGVGYAVKVSLHIIILLIFTYGHNNVGGARPYLLLNLYRICGARDDDGRRPRRRGRWRRWRRRKAFYSKLLKPLNRRPIQHAGVRSPPSLRIIYHHRTPIQ